MKLIKILTMSLAVLFIAPLSAAQKYTIDPLHTSVLWHISHFDFSHPVGKWLASGELVYDDKNLKNSKVDVTIDVAKMITGIPELDKHLSGGQFFDVAHFPKATFVSDKVEVVNNQIAKIQGKLTVKGVTKPVTLDVKLNKQGKSPITDQETLGFTGSTHVKRSDFGMTTLLPGLGDDVKLEIELEAYIPAPEKAKKPK